MRYFLKSIFLNIVSLLKNNKRITETETVVYFDLLATNGCGNDGNGICEDKIHI